MPVQNVLQAASLHTQYPIMPTGRQNFHVSRERRKRKKNYKNINSPIIQYKLTSEYSFVNKKKR